MPQVDVIVVGSGPSAVHAAYPLARSGRSVLMLDVGHQDTRYAPLIPDSPFQHIRRTDAAQHRYFLGDDFEAVPLGKVRVGAQLTAPRSYLTRDTETLTPLVSDSFTATESLALGGLGGGWGASAVRFDERDLAGFPLSVADLDEHYEAVSERIGVSGARDDLLPYYGDCASLQPPLETAQSVRSIIEAYRRKKRRLNAAGFHLGHPRLAVLSRDAGERLGQRYHDLDFYSDNGRSVYRPRYTVERMRSFPDFTYAHPYLVESFKERPGEEAIQVLARNIDDGRPASFTCRRLILAAGTMGTARIVLRSLDLYDTPVPLACNPHIYVPCVNLSALGLAGDEPRHSLTQVGIIYDPPPQDGPTVYAEAHVYRSLLLFKLAKESFLPVVESARVLRSLVSSFVILVIEHHDRPVPGKSCWLARDPAGGPDRLHVAFELEPEAARRQRTAEKDLMRHMRGLGCIPFQRIDPGHGSSIHYGGCFPMSADGSELTSTRDGRLRATRGVYIADGAAFPYLPAKPLTLSLMANADRIGSTLAREIG